MEIQDPGVHRKAPNDSEVIVFVNVFSGRPSRDLDCFDALLLHSIDQKIRIPLKFFVQSLQLLRVLVIFEVHHHRLPETRRRGCGGCSSGGRLRRSVISPEVSIVESSFKFFSTFSESRQATVCMTISGSNTSWAPSLQLLSAHPMIGRTKLMQVWFQRKPC
mmetsp:Transcript_47936/g.104519  ORF Transcript_47936/g.104519 Transcript_47936/m.104519 type:complete len:162 (+) Transcript_47936:48-533(+)